jgi:hypothetical protein
MKIPYCSAKAMVLTGPECASHLRITLPVRTSQRKTDLSPPADMKRLLSLNLNDSG